MVNIQHGIRRKRHKHGVSGPVGVGVKKPPKGKGRFYHSCFDFTSVFFYFLSDSIVEYFLDHLYVHIGHFRYVHYA